MNLQSWESMDWNGKEQDEIVELPLLAQYLKKKTSEVCPVLKLVYIKAKGLFILETAQFKCFINRKWNQPEYDKLMKEGLTNFVYSIEIHNGLWRVARLPGKFDYDLNETEKCLIFEPPMHVFDDSLVEDEVKEARQQELPF